MKLSMKPAAKLEQRRKRGAEPAVLAVDDKHLGACADPISSISSDLAARQALSQLPIRSTASRISAAEPA